MKTPLIWQRRIWYAIGALNLAFIFFYWWKGSGHELLMGGGETLIALGRLSGLLAVLAVLLQFFFMGRTPYLERVFGLDKLVRIHHTQGKVALILILLHPLLLTFGYAARADTGIVQQFLSFLTDYAYVSWALIGSLLFLIVVTLSLAIVRMRLKYETWYFVHLAVYLAIFFAVVHQFNIGSDIVSQRTFYLYWLALYAFVFGNHALFRFLRPLTLFARHKFRVERVVPETADVTSIYITGRNMKSFRVSPGQFMIFRFLAQPMWWEAHPFSLSMVPDGERIRITVKAVGDFTQRARRIPVDTSVVIDGPYGIFTDSVRASRKLLFIAGGIGITPIRSLIEQTLEKGCDALLLYGNRIETGIVFMRELNELASRHMLRVHHVVSNDPNFAGEKGAIDREKIMRLVPDILTREIYLCGPIPMMESVRHALHEIGVYRGRIHFEKFAL